ncbi:MAG: F0F1 ATP synthase subunit delta [Proteobacteria bacterium]|nr:F0F1 ATP synthase subunit delta [Pseudomonadota bacterium]
MAERKTLARPYAEAAFQLAQERNELKAWADMLSLAAVVAEDDQVRAVAHNPQVERAAIAELFDSVIGKSMAKDGGNFIKLLLENGRVDLLTEINELFRDFRADAEGRVEAEVLTAYKLTAAQSKAIAEGLKRRLGREVDIVSKVDASLLGGVVIRADDLVIDGSVKGYLQSLSSQING